MSGDFKGMTEKMNTKDMLDQGHNFAVIGMFVCLFAFSLSALSPWIVGTLKPAPVAAKVVAEEPEASKAEQTISEKVLGTFLGENKADEPEVVVDQYHWTDQIAISIVLIAIAGMVNCCVGLIKKQRPAVVYTGLVLGVTAIVIQFTMISIAIFVFLLLIVGLLSAMGVSF